MKEEHEVEEINDEDDELYVHHEFVVDKGQSPLRIDKYLVNKIEGTSRNKIQLGCDHGNVQVNDKPVKSNYKVKACDHIKVVFDRPPSDGFEVIPQDIPLDVVYEDDHVLVINKPPGLVVHPGSGNPDGTLVNGLVHYLSKDLPIMQGNQKDRPGIVHRIDKETSGLMVIGKTEEAITDLAKQFYDHSIEREYIALVWGDVENESGTIEGHIGRHETNRMQMFVYEDGLQGKHATTHYELVENLYYVSLVKCRLETGRTHQIRVHMKYIGHTLFNDARYGGDSILKGTVFTKYKQFVLNCFEIMPRQALHARLLGFVHPVTKEKMRFELDLPDDFAAVLEKWRGYLASRNI